MENYELLDECINEYKKLERLEGLTAQKRGQKFNSLIANVLKAHNIYAIPDQKSKGEIDVSFKIGNKRFILEAKWEKKKIAIEPIAKLGLRINQRISNNIGFILSMSGYTEDVIKEINGSGRPNVILLDKDFFFVLLHANINAEDLFNAVIDYVSFEGGMHISLSDITKYLFKTPIDAISQEIETDNEKYLNDILRPSGGEIKSYKVIKGDLPFGQCGISVSGNNHYVTLIDGIYKLDEKAFKKIFSISNPQNRCCYNLDQKKIFYVINGSVMAIDDKGQLFSITKRFPGHVRLFRDDDQINLISNGDDLHIPEQPVKIIKDIIGNKKEIIVDYPISSCVDACLMKDGDIAVIGSSGLYFYNDVNNIWKIDVLNGASISSLNEKIYYLENGISLKSINKNGKEMHEICKFNLSGSVGDFSILGENEYVFHLCYSDGIRIKTAIVYVKAA